MVLRAGLWVVAQVVPLEETLGGPMVVLQVAPQVELMVARRVVAQAVPLEEPLEARRVAQLVAPQVELMVELMVALQAEREEGRRVVPLVVET